MKEFRVALPNRPGQLAKLAGLLGQRNINIRSIAAISSANKSVVSLIPSNDAKTRYALRMGGFKYEEVDILTLDLTDRPGTLGRVAQKLGDANVNIESVYMLSKSGNKVKLALAVDSLAKAKRALKA